MKRQTRRHGLSSLQGETSKFSRRQFLSRGGKVLAGSVCAGVALNKIHAGEDNTIRLALVGCGGRGSGAAGNALSSTAGSTKLVAMADVFEDKQKRSYKALREQFGDKVDVPPERSAIKSMCRRSGVFSDSTPIAKPSTACALVT